MRKKKPLSACILDSRIAKSLEKLSKLQSYNGKEDPYGHVEYVENHLDFYHAKWVVKWKLFELTLIESSMA